MLFKNHNLKLSFFICLFTNFRFFSPHLAFFIEFYLFIRHRFQINAEFFQMKIIGFPHIYLIIALYLIFYLHKNILTFWFKFIYYKFVNLICIFYFSYSFILNLDDNYCNYSLGDLLLLF